MSIGLRTLPQEDRLKAVQRRLKQEKGRRGLGFLGAVDAQKYVGKQKESK